MSMARLSKSEKEQIRQDVFNEMESLEESLNEHLKEIIGNAIVGLDKRETSYALVIAREAFFQG